MSEFCLVGAEEKVPYHYTMCGLDDVYLTSGYELEDSEHGPVVTIHDMDGLHFAIGQYLALHKKTLSGKEVRYLRKYMDLTQLELGQVLGVSDQTVARWEKGESHIGSPEDKLVRFFFLGHTLGQVDVLKIARELSERDSASDRMLFAETNDGWKALAA